MALLSIGSDPKTVKGQKYGYRTAIMYMAPSDLSGVELCPFSKLAGCKAGCLNTSGRGNTPQTQSARLRRSTMFNTDLPAFKETLVKEITAFIKSATRADFIPVVRLNGTSDIVWENVYFSEKETIFTMFPDIQFYDYTKMVRRFEHVLPGNYHLTLSYSEANARFARMCIAVLTENPTVNLAVVAEELPDPFLGRRVVVGDDSDLRFLDPEGVIVRLTPKGRARKDTTGFVIRVLEESGVGESGSGGWTL